MAKLRSKEVSPRLLASCHTAGEISGWDGRPRLNKDERKIVHGHLHDLAQFKAVDRGLADEVVYIAHAPARVPSL